jgi:hypothetical protein
MTIWYNLCWFGTFFRFWYHVPTKIWQPCLKTLSKPPAPKKVFEIWKSFRITLKTRWKLSFSLYRLITSSTLTSFNYSKTSLPLWVLCLACIYMYIHMYFCVYTYLFLCLYICIFVFIHMYFCVYTYVFLCLCIRM